MNYTAMSAGEVASTRRDRSVAASHHTSYPPENSVVDKFLLRLLGLAVLLLAATVWVEPTVVPDERLLILRLRETNEVIKAARQRSRSWGARAVDAVVSPETPDVASKGPKRAGELTEKERRSLDRLVEEINREP